MKLSVLDQSPIANGDTAAAAITESLALARHCDRLGYERYWLAEHHNVLALAGTAPEVLMAAIAATTQRIRVGSAGVLLPNYSAYKVAEQFRVLEAIAPGRIDLGLGRGLNINEATTRALNPYSSASVDDFANQVRDVQHWLENRRLPDEHPYRDIIAQPQGTGSPTVWMLGTNSGAQLAAHAGLPYAFGYFLTDGLGIDEALAVYRQQFQPNERYPRPQATICVWALAADTQAEAEHLATTREYWRLGPAQGIQRPLISPAEAATYPYSEVERQRITQLREHALVGSGTQVAARLHALASRYELDEIVVNSWAFDSQARRYSYTLLAQACGL
ncbi:MAG: LLM class flavin-dependent oxidoreductase [Pseudomonadota bacterium]